MSRKSVKSLKALASVIASEVSAQPVEYNSLHVRRDLPSTGEVVATMTECGPAFYQVEEISKSLILCKDVHGHSVSIPKSDYAVGLCVKFEEKEMLRPWYVSREQETWAPNSRLARAVVEASQTLVVIDSLF